MSVEYIVLVNESGKPLGAAEKLSSHHAQTPLHLAFSCYVFNGQGKFLLTQRALSKKVWPGVWTNSVCGHPAPNEDIIDAIKRRLDYELGMTADDFQLLLPTYRYKTPPFKGIIENEFCPTYIAKATSEPQQNPAEVEAYRWVSWQEFVDATNIDTANMYSWWCKDQLKLLKDHPLIKTYSQSI